MNDEKIPNESITAGRNDGNQTEKMAAKLASGQSSAILPRGYSLRVMPDLDAVIVLTGMTHSDLLTVQKIDAAMRICLGLCAPPKVTAVDLF